jgi:hypothetical protein
MTGQNTIKKQRLSARSLCNAVGHDANQSAINKTQTKKKNDTA